MSKRGRPISTRPEQLTQLAAELIAAQKAEQEAAELEAKELKRQQGLIDQLDELEMKKLLIWFFEERLLKWDNELSRSQKLSADLKAEIAKTTGKSLVQQATHDLMQKVVDAIDAEPGMGFEHGWWIYCLRVWAGLTNPADDDNQDFPWPTGGQIKQAYRKYALKVHEFILT